MVGVRCLGIVIRGHKEAPPRVLVLILSGLPHELEAIDLLMLLPGGLVALCVHHLVTICRLHLGWHRVPHPLNIQVVRLE